MDILIIILLVILFLSIILTNVLVWYTCVSVLSITKPSTYSKMKGVFYEFLQSDKINNKRRVNNRNYTRNNITHSKAKRKANNTNRSRSVK